LLLCTNVFAAEYLNFNLGLQTLESALKQIHRAKYKYEIFEYEDSVEVKIYNSDNSKTYNFKEKNLTFNKEETLCRIMATYDSHAAYDYITQKLNKYIKIKEYNFLEAETKYQSIWYKDQNTDIYLSRKLINVDSWWKKLLGHGTKWITTLTYIDSQLCEHVYSNGFSENY
jgi:hypothetical protein